MKDGQEMTKLFEKGHTRLIFHAEHRGAADLRKAWSGLFEKKGLIRLILYVWSSGKAERRKAGSHKSSGEAERRKNIFVIAAAKL